jgi:20S proteasome alpha/beta subunit
MHSVLAADRHLLMVLPQQLQLTIGVLDSGLRNDLTVDDAIALGRRAILAAAHRDAYSGGSINRI